MKHSYSSRLTIAFCALWLVNGAMGPLAAQGAETPDGGKRAQVRLMAAKPCNTFLLMKGRSSLDKSPEAGNWLLISVEVTAPSGGFDFTPTLAGTGIETPRGPRAITGEAAPTADTLFLEYAAVPAFIPAIHISGDPGWVGLKNQAGSYIAAGWLGKDDNPLFALTSTPSISLQVTNPVALTFVFDVTGGQGAYTLSLGGAKVEVRPDAGGKKR